MPKIWAENLGEHRKLVSTNLMDAMEALLTQEPFEAMTMAKIARTAGIARNTIYNYAPDKETLLAAATESLSLDLLEEVTAVAASIDAPAERLSDVIGLILRWFAVNPYRRLVLEALFGSVPSALHARARAPLLNLHVQTDRILNEGEEAGEFRPLGERDLVRAFLTSIMQTAVVRLVEDPSLIGPAECETQRFILSALGHDTGRRKPRRMGAAGTALT